MRDGVPELAGPHGQALPHGMKVSPVDDEARARLRIPDLTGEIGMEHDRRAAIVKGGPVAGIEVTLTSKSLGDHDVMRRQLDMEVDDVVGGLLPDCGSVEEISDGNENILDEPIIGDRAKDAVIGRKAKVAYWHTWCECTAAYADRPDIPRPSMNAAVDPPMADPLDRNDAAQRRDDQITLPESFDGHIPTFG